MNGYANTNIPQPTTNDTNPDPGPSLPIDKNLILLAIAGTFLGLHIIHKHKTKQKKTLN